jgi:uncharacterized membrane protein YccC
MNKNLSIILGLVIGIICLLLKLPGWLNLVPWCISAVTIGYLSLDRKNSIFNGLLFGIFLFFSYNHIGFLNGNMPYTKFIVSNLLFSFIGGIAGIIGSFIGHIIKLKVSK